MATKSIQPTLKSILKNSLSFSISKAIEQPTTIRVTYQKDLPLSTINPFNTFCDISFNVSLFIKAIDTYYSVL